MANVRFAKMAPGIDGHPKIRRAGRNGREVFLFILRRNADLDRSGRVPLSYVESWYLADQLMMSEAEAIEGLDRCVTAGLVRRSGDHVSILGWDDEWAKAPLDEAERKRRQREKDEANAEKSKRKRSRSRNVTNANVTQSDCPDSHASEESREEEKRTEEKREGDSPPARAPIDSFKAKVDKAVADRVASGPHRQAIAEFHSYYQRTHGGACPTWKDKNAALMAALVKAHGVAEITRRIHVLETSPPKWPLPPWDMPTFSAHFDKIAAPSTGNETALDVALRMARGGDS